MVYIKAYKLRYSKIMIYVYLCTLNFPQDVDEQLIEVVFNFFDIYFQAVF